MKEQGDTSQTAGTSSAQTAMDELVLQLSSADPSAIKLVVQISRTARELTDEVQRRIATFPSSLQQIILNAVIGRLQDKTHD
jgi:hypothetical protein